MRISSKLATKIASILPAWLIYFATIRLWALASHDTNASNVRMTEALNLWESEHPMDFIYD